MDSLFFLSFDVFWFLILWLLLHQYRYLKAIKRIYCYDEGKISQAESFSHVSTDAESRSDLLSMNKRLWKDLKISACVRICISFSRSLELLLKPSDKSSRGDPLVYGHVFGRRTSSVVSPNSAFSSFKYSDSQLHPPLFKFFFFFTVFPLPPMQ